MALVLDTVRQLSPWAALRKAQASPWAPRSPQADDDSSFLAHQWPGIRRPLREVRGARRILFSPGMGLGLGDQYMCLPLLDRLQERFALAQIDLLTDYPPFWRARGLAGVRIIAREKSDSRGALRTLGEADYDLAILGYHPGCLAPLSRQPKLTVFCAGENLASFRSFFAHGGSCWEISLPSCRQAISESDKFMGLFEDFGLGRPLTRRAGGAAFPPRMPAALPGLRVLIHPSTAKSYKRWPGDHWARLAHLLMSDGASVSISPGITNEEADIAAEIARTAQGAQALERVPLSQFLEELREFDVALSADTFLPHAVACDGGPVSLAVYGPTDPLRFCPVSARNFFVSPLEISPETFFTAVKTLLALCAGDIDSLARPGGARACAQAAHDLVAEVESGGGAAAPSGRGRLQSLLSAYCHTLRPASHPLMTGGEEMLGRLSGLLASEPLPRALRATRLSPPLRSAHSLITVHGAGQDCLLALPATGAGLRREAVG